MKLIKKTFLAAAATAAMALAPLSASAALTFTFNWAGADLLEGGSPDGRALSNPTDELKFTAESVLRFTSGTPFTAGATFEDFIVLRFDQLFLNGAENGEGRAGSYGGTFANGGRREITLTARLTGRQIDDSTYQIDDNGLLNFYYDSGATAGTYTGAQFSGPLTTFTDGTLVETGRTIQPSGGVNSTTIPDGTIDVTAQLFDNIVPGGFERDAQGNPITVSMKIGLFDANNALCAEAGQPGGTASCDSNTGAILALFGETVQAGDLHTKSDGSMTKNLIPEPTSLALLGAALLGLGASRRRKG